MELKSNFENSRMLKKTGSWIYCNECNKTVGYLCYSTYQQFKFEFKCKCGSSGIVDLQYPCDKKLEHSSKDLIKKKNRLCCPNDEAPLFTIVEKHIAEYSYQVTCNGCDNTFVIKNKFI